MFAVVTFQELASFDPAMLRFGVTARRESVVNMKKPDGALVGPRIACSIPLECAV